METKASARADAGLIFAFLVSRPVNCPWECGPEILCNLANP
jgi:hypothetical protein